jgi:hypothetical protein
LFGAALNRASTADIISGLTAPAALAVIVRVPTHHFALHRNGLSLLEPIPFLASPSIVWASRM